MVWAIEAARACLVVFGCAASGWAVGFGMGYRRGVNDAVARDIACADQRVSAERFSAEQIAADSARLLVQHPRDRAAHAGGDRAGGDRPQAEFGNLAAAFRDHRAHPADQNAERAEIGEAAQRIGDDQP
jgi:hypothetical protein